jgi:hypothetical protein
MPAFSLEFSRMFLLHQPVVCGCAIENIHACLIVMWSNGATPGHHMATTLARAHHGLVAMAGCISNAHYLKHSQILTFHSYSAT